MNYLRDGQFKEGSMAPKLEAAIRFVEGGGDQAIITSLGTLTEALEKKIGTHVVAPKV